LVGWNWCGGRFEILLVDGRRAVGLVAARWWWLCLRELRFPFAGAMIGVFALSLSQKLVSVLFF
jgi:hypothetical protein